MTVRGIAKRAIQLGANQKLSELTPLVGLLKRRRLEVVVEIGTARGGTLAAWCALAQPDAVLVSVDLPGGRHGGGYSEDEAVRYRAHARPRQDLHFLRRDSHDPETLEALEQILEHRPIDFLMIDGDHTYDGVAADYRMYGPLVRDPGGVIAFHDVLPHPQVPDCQVDRFWDELKRTHNHLEFTDPGDDRGWGQWGGIGVVIREP